MRSGTNIFRCILAGIVSLFLIAEGAAFSACAGSSSPGTQTAPSSIQNSPAIYSQQNGNLTVTMITTPNPPIRGVNIIDILLLDANGKGIPDAKVSLDVDMVNMSHGVNIVAASPAGEGRYTGRVNFLMPGPWRILVRIERAGQTNIVRFDFLVNFR